MSKPIKAVYRVQCWESEFGVRSMGYSDFQSWGAAYKYYLKHQYEPGADGQYFFADPPKLVDLNRP